jgi:ribosome-associated translation inhibitor RaiA
MKFNITVRRTKVIPTVKNYAMSKIKKFDKIIPVNSICDIEFRGESKSRSGKNKVININLDIPGGKVVHLAKAGHSFEEAIDLAQLRLEKIIKKWRRKKLGLRRRDKIYAATKKMILWFPEKITIPRFSKKTKENVTNKTVQLSKPMTESEAVEQIKLINDKDNILIFRNIQTNQISVILKKKNKSFKIFRIQE